MIRIGVDIGGTFTDAIAIDDSSGEYWTSKVPTTYPDPSSGFLKAMDHLMGQRQLELADVSAVIHGTTLVTNAIVEREGGPVGLLATEGFADTLWIRSERRYNLFDVNIEFQEPLVARRHVSEISERTLYDGRVHKPLDEAAAAKTIDALAATGVVAIAVCLMHSYANPTHEQRLKELIAERHPGMRISLSSEVWPEGGEYHRMSTTVANAFVQPVVESYLDALVKHLTGSGFTGILHLMLSNGGTASVDTGRRFPVQLIESGPAAGVLAAAFMLHRTAEPDALSFDMGGTTAKLSLIEGGEPLQADLIEAARLQRHAPGSGIPIKVPVVDLLEIGSGGGSIARIDHMGLLKVGPDSAGSDPGPACYGWGGEDPTVTDADLVLGYLNPNNFLGGEMRLDPKASERAIRDRIAEPTGLDLIDAAWGIHQVVNQSMGLAAKMHVLERGHDPSKFALVAFGGAGPVHAYGVARTIGVSKVIIPPSAGVAASFGFLVAPIAFDQIASLRMQVSNGDWTALNARIEQLEASGLAIVREATAADVTFSRAADMRFVGQGYEVTVALPSGMLDPSQVPVIRSAFERVYSERYGHLPADRGEIEVVRLRVRVATPSSPPNLPRLDPSEEEAVPVAIRRAYFGEIERFTDTPVFASTDLRPGHRISGPAIIEAFDTTVVVGPSGAVEVDESGFLFITIDAGG